MNNAVDAGDDLFDLRHVGEIGGDEILIRAKIGRLADIADAQGRIDALEQFAQAAADIARGASEQNVFHDRFPPP